MERRSGRTLIYALASSSMPEFFRYVGVSVDIDARLILHSNAETRIGMWMFWQRTCGYEIHVHELGVCDSKQEALAAEKAITRELYSPYLLDEKMWRRLYRDYIAPDAAMATYTQAVIEARRCIERGHSVSAESYIDIALGVASMWPHIAFCGTIRSMRLVRERQKNFFKWKHMPIIRTLAPVFRNYSGPNIACDEDMQ